MKNQAAYTRYSDIIRIQNDNQILKLKRSGESRYLIQNEVPIGAIWRGNNESSAFYAWIANINSEIIKVDALEKMNQKLLNKIERNDSLKDVILPLLNIVENGWYQIFYHEPYPITVNWGIEGVRPKYLGSQYYNFCQDQFYENKKTCIWVDDTIVFTQDLNSLDEERVEYYKERILEGRRPTIITMAITDTDFENVIKHKTQKNPREDLSAEFTLESATHCVQPQFIIDGHHKAKAYIELKEKPSIISLIKLQLEKDDFTDTELKDSYRIMIENQINEKIE